MTSIHPASRPSPFRFLPSVPGGTAPVAAAATTPLIATKSTEHHAKVDRKWLVWGNVVMGLRGLSLIPLPYAVLGDAQLQSTPGERQTSLLPVAGKLQKLYVHPKQAVQAGQPVRSL
jgi:multidrug efflux pump subunit AcrA (membrane-fusion protein)